MSRLVAASKNINMTKGLYYFFAVESSPLIFIQPQIIKYVFGPQRALYLISKTSRYSKIQNLWFYRCDSPAKLKSCFFGISFTQIQEKIFISRQML